MNDAKLIRGQMRQIVKELYPHMMTQEQHAQINAMIEEKMKVVQAQVAKSLKDIEEKQKNALDFVIRNITQNTSLRSK